MGSSKIGAPMASATALAMAAAVGMWGSSPIAFDSKGPGLPVRMLMANSGPLQVVASLQLQRTY